MTDQVFDDMIADHLDEQDTIIGTCEMCGAGNVQVFLNTEINKWWCVDSFECSITMIESEDLDMLAACW